MAQIDPNTITNEPMVVAIQAMKADLNEKTQNDMINAMIRSRFIVPVKFEEPAEGEQGQRVTFTLVENADKQKFFMAFTDAQELARYTKGEESQTTLMMFDNFANLIIDHNAQVEGFVINPYNPEHNLVFPKKIIESIKEQKDRMMAHMQENQAHLREPATLPKAVCDTAIEYFKAHENVSKAYIQEMLIQGKEGYLIAVDFTGIPEITLNELKQHMVEVMGDRPLSLISVETEAGKVVSERAKAPFYVKGEKAPTEEKPKKKGLFGKK